MMQVPNIFRVYPCMSMILVSHATQDILIQISGIIFLQDTAEYVHSVLLRTDRNDRT